MADDIIGQCGGRFMSGNGSPSRKTIISLSAKKSGGNRFPKLAATFAQLWQQSGASAPNQSLREPSSEHSIRCCAPVISHTFRPRNSFTSS